MTIALTVILTAVVLLIAWRMGGLKTFEHPMIVEVSGRLGVCFVASWLGYGVVWWADKRQVSDPVKAGIMIALLIGAIIAARWLILPLVWGFDDWLAERDAQEVQP